jgi:hypothetical protein
MHPRRKSLLGFFTTEGTTVVVDIFTGKELWKKDMDATKNEVVLIHFHDDFFLFCFEQVYDADNPEFAGKPEYEYRPGTMEVWSMDHGDYTKPWCQRNVWCPPKDWRFNVGTVPMLTKTIPETGDILMLIHIWHPPENAVFWPAFVLSSTDAGIDGELYIVERRLERPVISSSTNEIFTWVREESQSFYLTLCAKTGTVKRKVPYNRNGGKTGRTIATEDLGRPWLSCVVIDHVTTVMSLSPTTNFSDAPCRTLDLGTSFDAAGTFHFFIGEAGRLYMSGTNYNEAAQEWEASMYLFHY